MQNWSTVNNPRQQTTPVSLSPSKMGNCGCEATFIVSDSKANDCCFREALKDNVFHRPPSPHTCCVDPAADQAVDGGKGEARPPGWTNPLSHTHICPRPPPPAGLPLLLLAEGC